MSMILMTLLYSKINVYSNLNRDFLIHHIINLLFRPNS